MRPSANINIFTTPLEFEITFEDGTKELFRINQDQNDQQFTLDFSKQITDLVFDPKGWLIKKINSFQKLDENGNYVVMCRTGGRSAQICEFLTNQNFRSVSNLSGGINEWARKIDTSLPAY